jgi:hypothetical protein
MNRRYVRRTVIVRVNGEFQIQAFDQFGQRYEEADRTANSPREADSLSRQMEWFGGEDELDDIMSDRLAASATRPAGELDQ